MAVALYPGAFKPPHRGHFEVVKSLLNNSYSGKVYSIDDYFEQGSKALQGEVDKELQGISKVVVFIGGGVRNGLDSSKAKEIWQVYAKHLPGQIEIYDDATNPMLGANNYAKEHTEEEFYAITGIRNEEDLPDLKRVTTFRNRDNVQGLIIKPKGGESEIRATNFRNALLSGNLDQITDFFPKELSRQEVLGIVNTLKNAIIAEIMNEGLEKALDSWNKSALPKYTPPPVQEATRGTAIAPTAAIKSADREKLNRLYTNIKNLLGDKFYSITFQQDHIRVGLKDQVGTQGFNFTPYMGSILEYMLDQKMNILPLPEIKVKKDLVEAEDFFGKTAYYDPNAKEVVLYTQGRHPKDVMRSFTHEMIHHIQNLEGRLNNISTSNTNESQDLLELEKEAYLQGNITFRNWEDKIKNSDEYKKPLNEGKFDKLSNDISSDIFRYWKEQIDSGEDGAQFKKTYKGLGAEFDIEATLDLTFETEEIEVLDTTGAGTDEKGDFILIDMEVDEELLPQMWEEISMTLKDLMRHEVEHLTHNRGGATSNPNKALRGDLARREKIKVGDLPRSSYFKLKKEVDANLQGLHFRAKKEKKPFKEVVARYLDAQQLTDKERKEILDIWRKRLPALAIRQEI